MTELQKTIKSLSKGQGGFYFPSFLKGDPTKDYFVATADGDGMVNAGINSGDRLMFVATDTPDDYSIVFALLNNGERLCRRYIRDGEKIRLRREDGVTPDIVTDQCQILGQMVMLLRKFPQVS